MIIININNIYLFIQLYIYIYIIIIISIVFILFTAIILQLIHKYGNKPNLDKQQNWPITEHFRNALKQRAYLWLQHVIF